MSAPSNAAIYKTLSLLDMTCQLRDKETGTLSLFAGSRAESSHILHNIVKQDFIVFYT